MNKSKRPPTWALLLILLLVTNLVWVSWNIYQHAGLIAAARQFRVEVLHTNEMNGVGLFEIKTGEPLWARFTTNGQTTMENHFFRGRDVFDVTVKSNRPPVYNVFFYGAGKSVTWWLNAGGSDTFTERFIYDANGNLSGNEVWYSETWHPVERRTGKNGIVVRGQWCQLAFDKKGMWTIETP